jgi:hypothetical protein
MKCNTPLDDHGELCSWGCWDDAPVGIEPRWRETWRSTRHRLHQLITAALPGVRMAADAATIGALLGAAVWVMTQ